LFTVITLLVIAAAASLAIFFAKGYRVSPTERRILGTGIMTVSSEPDAASVFIDGHLTTATNATVSSLSPKKYAVRLVKEGFIPWEKEIEILEGVVTEVKATLFPAIPTIYPLTFTSVDNPVLSPDGSKLAYIVPTGKKGGVWVWTLSRNQPIAFARSAEPHQIAQTGEIDFSQSSLRWSPDSKQVLATVSGNNFLLEDNGINQEPRDITPILDATLQGWAEDVEAKEATRILALQDGSLRRIASDSAFLRWSPDETKFMAKKEEIEKDEKGLISGISVYDLELNQSHQLPPALAHLWLPDSKHIILVEEGTISLIEFDGTNKAVIFAGSFLDNFVFPWPDSSRLVIISSIPTPTASEPNLYGINLR